MKIFRGKFGWSTSAHSKAKDGSKIEHYIDVGFRKGSEPDDDDLEGDLVFKTKDGSEIPCFLSCYVKKDGSKVTKLVLLDTQSDSDGRGVDTRKSVQTSLTGTDRDVLGHIDNNVKFDEEDLPFY